MSRASQGRIRHAALLVCTTTVLTMLAGCSTGDKKSDSAGTASGSARSAEAISSPPGTQSQLPITLDGVASAVAATDQGVYVADTGKGNKVDSQGYEFSGKGGRLLLLEPGATSAKDVATKLGVPMSIAATPDGTVTVLTINPKGVQQFSAGSTTPTSLPFTFGESIQDPTPWKIAVTPAGDVAVLTEENIQVLPKGGPTPTVIDTGALEKRFLAVDPKGALYFVSGSFDEEIEVIDSGSTEPRTFEKADEANPTKRVIAMAFDASGDRYTLTESCGPDQPEGDIRPCKTTVYALSKFAGNSTTPSDIPVTGLTSPIGIAVGKTDIFIADGKRVIKIVK